jgi:hypothetical protein
MVIFLKTTGDFQWKFGKFQRKIDIVLKTAGSFLWKTETFLRTA